MLSLTEFCNWLADTSASHLFQEVLWIVPAAQSIHILAIAIAMSALLMIHLRSIGVLARDQTRSEIVDRFLPALWIALPVLLATGSVLIVAEPARSLRNPAFYWKMGLLLVGIVITLTYARPLRRDPSWWDETRRRQLASGIAVTSLILWVAIVFCGRWIAYVSPF
ncbi:DUF6644 family protein [Steroidobacter flavus]|uniref:DUF6644 family protein n=1 Tax=Steroidobacter flavus TaxID=1842136 RepID=A0ABV8SZW2_9GAMM